MNPIHLSLVVVLLAFGLVGMAREVDTSYTTFNSKQEKKLLFVFQKFTEGSYQEVLNATTPDNSFAENPIHYRSQMLLYRALSQYALQVFENAEKTVSAMQFHSDEFQPDGNYILSLICLTTYYTQTNNLTKTHNLIIKLDSLTSRTPLTSFIKYEFLLSKAHLECKRALFKNALTLAEEVETYFKNTLQDKTKLLFSTETHDQFFRKLRYAQTRFLKAQCLVGMGRLSSADSLISEIMIWNKKNLPSYYPYLQADLLQLKAEISVRREKYSEAADYYLKAYTTADRTEEETSKIHQLTMAIEYFFRTANIIYSDNYQRRLQQYAQMNANKNNNLRLAYLYTEAIRKFTEGENTKAQQKITELFSSFKTLPPTHPFYIQSKKILSEIYFRNGELDKLFKNEQDISELLIQHHGSSSLTAHKMLLKRAFYEIKYGSDFALAASIMSKSYPILQAQIDSLSAEHIQYLEAYRELYHITDEINLAAKASLAILPIALKNYGEQSAQYIYAMANAANYLMEAGMYSDGIKMFQACSNSLDNTKIYNIELKLKIYLLMAKLYQTIGEFDKSQMMSAKALLINYQSPYNDILQQAEAAEISASVYLRTNNYFKAEKALNKSLHLKARSIPSESPVYYPLKLNFTLLNISTGNYDEVENHLTRLKSITEKVYGEKSLKNSEVELLYADYYLSISDFRKAEEALYKALKIIESKLGTKHLKRAEVLLKMLTLMSKRDEIHTNEIEHLYAEALNVVREAFTENNPLYMEILQRKAAYLIRKNELNTALKLIEQIQSFWRGKLGEDNQYIAQTYEMKGDIAYTSDKFTEAEQWYNKAQSIFRKVFSDNHPSYTDITAKLAYAYYMQKNFNKSVELMDEIIPRYLEFITKYFSNLSFRQKSKYWNSIKDKFEFYNTLAFHTPKKNVTMCVKVYNNILATKALMLNSGLKLLNHVTSSNDTTLVRLYNEWIEQKEYLIAVLAMSKQQLDEQGIDKLKIESKIEELEKLMSQRSSLFSENYSSKRQNINLAEVKKALSDNEYAIEIVRYRYFNKIFTDSVIYVALITDNSTYDGPQVVLMNYGKEMEKKYLRYYRNTTVLQTHDDLSYAIYWKPIKEKIKDNAVVYLSADGVYNQINIEMLKSDQNKFAIDVNQFIYVSNTKDLASSPTSTDKKNKESRKGNAYEFVLCGNPDFYTDNYSVTYKSVSELPGAEREIKSLSELLKANGKNSVQIIKKHLTEDTIRSIQNPRVLHIATHGYFKESNLSSEDDITSSPLLNSGLMLCGAGDIVDNKNNNYINQKSGILTAYEAMNMTLDNTELVVLSACETGRGEIQVGEGVLGLQRSFLLAGSKAIIVSLFKVNDEVTEKLMYKFYELLLKTGDKRKAFTQAKREIKEQYTQPIFWGAFIMIEGKPERTKYSGKNTG